MFCYITCHVMLFDICHVINIKYVMLYITCHVIEHKICYVI